MAFNAVNGSLSPGTVAAPTCNNIPQYNVCQSRSLPCLLNKTPDASPDSASNTSVIYTILSLLNLVKPVQTRRETHA
ncbi:hypothetical protein AMK81_01335 [Escherichia coli]|nr:hypothetical protein AMK81_01335 [Escherichia coli]